MRTQNNNRKIITIEKKFISCAVKIINFAIEPQLEKTE